MFIPRADPSKNDLKPIEATVNVMSHRLNTRLEIKAPLDLGLVLWPPEEVLPPLFRFKGYLYNGLEGRNTYVYIIDQGIDAWSLVGMLVDKDY